MITVRPSFRPSGPAEIADGAFEVVRLALAPMLAISFLVNVPLFVSAAGLAWWVRERGLLWGSPRYFAGLAVLAIALGGFAWLRAIGTGALAHASLVAIAVSGKSGALGAPQGSREREQAIAGREPRAAASLAASLRLGGAVSGAIALRAAMFAMGLLACVLPAVVVAGGFAFVTHAIVLERRTLTGALLRSARVAPHAGGGLLAAGALATGGWILAAAQIFLLLRLAGVIGQAALPVPDVTFPPSFLAWTAVALGKIVIDPLVSAAAASAWVDGLIRADGLDLELRSQRLAGEPLLVDPEAA